MKATIAAVVILAVLMLSGCAAPVVSPPPVAPPPMTVHVLRLREPMGAGTVTLTKTVSYQHLYPTARYEARSTYYAAGAVKTTDDLGEWEFGYTKLNLNTLGLEIFGLHALQLTFKNMSAGTVEIEWSRTVLVDRNGRTHAVIHKGVKLSDRSGALPPSVIPPGAILEDFVFPSDNITFRPLGRSSYWAAPPFLEEIPPGSDLVLVLGVRGTGGQETKTFRFRTE